MREHKKGDSLVDYPRDVGLPRAVRERMRRTALPYRVTEEDIEVLSAITADQHAELQRLVGYPLGRYKDTSTRYTVRPRTRAQVEQLLDWLREQDLPHAVTTVRSWPASGHAPRYGTGETRAA